MEEPKCPPWMMKSNYEMLEERACSVLEPGMTLFRVVHLSHKANNLLFQT
jgi:hypothetical protein